MTPTQGIRHISTTASDPQANVDFYQHVLGQRLVKTTVNFDDPGTYHLYYGDDAGSPGTIMTFFPMPGLHRGQPGNGQVGAVAYTIAADALAWWQDWLHGKGVLLGQPEQRFGETVLTFHDPDGMRLELITAAQPPGRPRWTNSPIPAVHALRGFHGVTLWLENTTATGRLLINQLGFRYVTSAGSRACYQAAGGGPGLMVDLLHRPGQPRGRAGAGAVHHVAFRAADDAVQLTYQEQLRAAGQQVTPVQERLYFRSIYFREPGGVLFEIATDAPGFAIDEPVAALGRGLQLPPWLEARRSEIAGRLPPISP